MPIIFRSGKTAVLPGATSCPATIFGKQHHPAAAPFPTNFLSFENVRKQKTVF